VQHVAEVFTPFKVFVRSRASGCCICKSFNCRPIVARIVCELRGGTRVIRMPMKERPSLQAAGGEDRRYLSRSDAPAAEDHSV